MKRMHRNGRKQLALKGRFWQAPMSSLGGGQGPRPTTLHVLEVASGPRSEAAFRDYYRQWVDSVQFDTVMVGILAASFAHLRAVFERKRMVEVRGKNKSQN